MKKFISVAVLLIIMMLTTNVFAAVVTSKNTTFEVVENNICNIKITDYASFEKKMIDSNIEGKNVTIQLTVKNEATTPLDEPCEIVLLIDNSDSMTKEISTNLTRMQAVTKSAKALAAELLESDTVKVSVVSFSSANSLNATAADPDWIEEGTIADATLRTALTDSLSTVNSAIDAVSSTKLGARTNIEAGLTLAEQQFSGTIDNKIIILLTDGVPNLSMGRPLISYSQADIDRTKNKLKSLSSSGVTIFSMMTQQTAGKPNTEELNEDIGTYEDIAAAVFGTPTNPTTGKYYYVTDDKIEETISKTILDDLKAVDTEILRDIDIYDYFPQDIVNNFKFEYVQKPTKGTVSEDIDLQNNMIVWHIDELGYNETATLSYKLTVADEIEQSIINVVLDTNEKVDITTENVKDDNGEKKIITGDETPKVRLNEVKPEVIPQTGLTNTSIIIISLAVVATIALGSMVIFKNREIK